MCNEMVCVLMSTYNGHKYIREQIDSILNQERVQVRLIVRDDGSTDETLDILNEYQKAGKLYIVDASANFGAAKSFMELLYSARECGYYAFADQDDVWKADKLIKAIELIECNSKIHIPTLYASNQILYIDGEEQNLRFAKVPNYTMTGIICGNLLSGCTMVFNKELRDILINTDNRPSDEILRIRMHDTWVAAVAVLCGQLIYDHNSYINYRIHENNTIGVKSGSIVNKIKKFVNKMYKPNNRYGRSKLAMELQKINDSLDINNDIVKCFAYARENKRAILIDQFIKKECPEKRLVFVLKVFMGWI